MLRVIGAHYKSRDERMARHLHSPDVCGDPTCDITLSFFLKGGREGGRGEKSVSIFACENPFAIIYRRVIFHRTVKTMGDNLKGASLPPFSNVFEEENWTG